MSDRYTISVYVDGRIADIGYYRNWDARSLFFEAVALGLLFGDCVSREEYLVKRYGTESVAYSVEPEVYENTEANLKWLEECSEWPYIVDLTLKQIYPGRRAKTAKELDKLPSALKLDNVVRRRLRERGVWGWEGQRRVLKDIVYALEIIRTPKYAAPGMDYSVFLDHCRIPFGLFDRARVMDALRGLGDALSNEVRELLERERGLSA